MKKDHEDQTKDLEKRDQNVDNVTMWVENEKNAYFQTRDLESFLKNKSDAEIRNATAFAEAVNDAENLHDIEENDLEQRFGWYDEDHNEAFNFTSDFAEELLREERPNRAELIRNQKKIAAEQQRKDDLLIKHSNQLLEAAEKQKAHFRKTVNHLETELQETYNNWEASEISNRKEMEKLRIELEQEKKNNAVKSIEIPEVKEVEQKCKVCKFTCKDSNTLDNHMSAVHRRGREQKCKACKFTCKGIQILDNHMVAVHTNQNCHMCVQQFTSKAALRNHVRNHLMNKPEYSCELCNNKFQNLEDAQTHASKPCGKL